MALASDLMGYGVPANVANKVSDGGAQFGSLAITAAGNSYATGADILADERLVTCSNGNNTLALSLPLVAGNVNIGDKYTIVNTGVDTVVVWASSGVTISARGTNTSFALLGAGGSLVVFPITTEKWGGYGGQSA